MRCWAIIPIKGKGEGKTRLAGVLTAADREALVKAMLVHVVETVRQTPSIERLCLVGPSRHGTDEAIPLLGDPGTGLNETLEKTLAEAATGSLGRLIVIAGDLPCLTSHDLELLANIAPGTLGIAPDRHGTGTNALSLPLPEASHFTFQFGAGSREKHRKEAERLGIAPEMIITPGLARDVDEPSDLADAAGIWTWNGSVPAP